MSHNFSFGSSINESRLNPLNLDSPVARDRFSRFSRLTESFNVSRLGHSALGSSQGSIINESSATVLAQAGTDLGNISDISGSVNIDLNSTLQLPGNGTANGTAEENDADDVARFVIFENFFELNQEFSKANQTFDLVQNFDRVCEEHLLSSKAMLESKVRSDNETAYLNKFSSLTRLERNTWRLLGALYQDRLQNSAGGEEETVNLSVEAMEVEEDLHLRLSDFELAERAMKRNATLREMQIVLDWLESVYDEEPLDKVEFYSDGPVYWENTLHALKVSAKGPNTRTPLSLSKGRTYCNQMDPDAAIRTGMPLHDLDKEDENRLFLHIYKLIRAGQLQEGKDIAERLGYHWLSATLDGWLLHHDPNYKPDGEDSQNIPFDSALSVAESPKSIATSSAAIKHLQPIMGNPYRDLWKYTAWKTSKMEGTNLHERAIYAIFSGNRAILMPLCTKWNDKLWAYFKCSLDVHLENLLIDSNIPKPDRQPRNIIELPDAYWDNKLSAEDIFRELSSQASGRLSGFSTAIEEEYHQTVEQCLILGQIDQLIDHLYEWSKTIATNRESRSKTVVDSNLSNSTLSLFGGSSVTANKTKEEEMAKVVEPNLLRFFAHLVISMRNLGLIVDEKQGALCVEILETYIAFLIEYKLIELVAFYALFLPEERQVTTFASLLEGIDNEADRKLCILVGKQSKLNLSAILPLVVENIRTGNTSYQTKTLSGQQQEKPSLLKQQVQLTSTVTEEDLRKISSLDWLVLDEESPQLMELLWQSNALLRSFLLDRKLDQAKQTFAMLPSDIVNGAYQEWKVAYQMKSNSVVASLDIDNVVREYICFKTFFEANESFQKWHNYLYNSKPREPARPKTMTRLGDRVAYEQATHLYEEELKEWHKVISNQADVTSEKLMSFLAFPEGVWINVDDLKMMQEMANLEEDDSVSNDGSATPSPKLETRIEEAIDGDQEEDIELDLASDCEIRSADLRCSSSAVIKRQLDRKAKDWSVRSAQLDALRRIYVPQFVFLLYSVYTESGNYPQCLRIADIVADESSRLYITFTQEQMADLLNKLREVSIELLNQVPDPLGYVGN